jgi:hypothetical protein
LAVSSLAVSLPTLCEMHMRPNSPVESDAYTHRLM